MYKYDKMYCSNAKYLFSHLFSEPENICLELWLSRNISSVSSYQLISLYLFLNAQSWWQKDEVVTNSSTLSLCKSQSWSGESDDICGAGNPSLRIYSYKQQKSISHVYQVIKYFYTASSQKNFSKNCCKLFRFEHVCAWQSRSGVSLWW